MDDLHMYVKDSGPGTPKEYAFGPEWVAMALYMDDAGYDTEEAAVLEWYYKIFKQRKFPGYYIVTTRDAEVEQYMIEHSSEGESKAILDWYHNVYKMKGADDADNRETESDPPAEDHTEDG